MRKDVYLHDPLTSKTRGYTTTDWLCLTGTAVLCRVPKATTRTRPLPITALDVPIQKLSFSANWIWREVVEVLVMTPAVELTLVPAKTPKVGVAKVV